MNIEEKLQTICDALEDKKAIDIKVIDISKVSVIADYLVIAGGNNKSQVQAMVDNVEDNMMKNNEYTKHVEGYSTANWILLDYSDIIVHVFNQEDRLFYDLERLWKDGKEVEIADIINK